WARHRLHLMLSSPLNNGLDGRKRGHGRYPAQFSTQLAPNMNTGIKLATALATILTALTAVGQQQPDSRVEQAAFSRPASGSAAQKVTFARQAARVGDELEQNLGLELRMTMTMRKANEIAGKSQTTVRTDQKRVMTTTEVDNGRAIAV